MKVIIAGGRFFDDYLSLKRFCDKILINQENVEIVSGKAKDADSLGEMYARESTNTRKNKATHIVASHNSNQYNCPLYFIVQRVLILSKLPYSIRNR